MNPCAVLPTYWCSKPDPSATWVLLHAIMRLSTQRRYYYALKLAFCQEVSATFFDVNFKVTVQFTAELLRNLAHLRFTCGERVKFFLIFMYL